MDREEKKFREREFPRRATPENSRRELELLETQVIEGKGRFRGAGRSSRHCQCMYATAPTDNNRPARIHERALGWACH